MGASDNYRRAATVREALASRTFDLATVEKAIAARAADGYRDLRVAQKLPFDLSRSPAARTLEDWLDARHYRYVWQPVPASADPMYSALSEDYCELAIFW